MSLEKSIPTRVVELIQSEGLEVGTHLPSQMLADRLKVSRSPVNQALAYLHNRGIVKRERNRGYFVARPIRGSLRQAVSRLGLNQVDIVTDVYFGSRRIDCEVCFPTNSRKQCSRIATTWLPGTLTTCYPELPTKVGRRKNRGMDGSSLRC